MNRQTFNPNAVIIPNSCYFGFAHTIKESPIVFLSVPWDATTSYGEGTADGPRAIMEASYQLEFYDFDLAKAWEIGYATIPISTEIRAKSQETRTIAQKIIQFLEKGSNIDDPEVAQQLIHVNQACANLNDWVYDHSKSLLNQGKLIGLIGGDHSVSLGYLKAIAEKHHSYSILQIDAHADLRQAYEGFTYSHASIMYNALGIGNISSLVQVGVRDVCQEEMERINSNDRIILFDDWQLKNNTYQGMSWAQQCEQIVTTLGDRVYISFDIDGLNPAFCPHTGTPVPGGLDFNQAIYLVQTLVKTGKTIIGFDLCEVAPGKGDQWDGNVGARLLYKLANLMYLSQECYPQ